MKGIAIALAIASVVLSAEPEPQNGFGDMPPPQSGPGDRVLLPPGFWNRSGNDPDPPIAMSSTRIVWGDERDEMELPPAIGFWEEVLELMEADNLSEASRCFRRAWRALLR